MLFFFFLTGGLFLGWSLGSNDAANIFGTAVGSKMVRFRTAAIVSSIFIVLGAVLQGSGTTETLGKLGAVDAIGGAFTVSLCAAFTVFLMNRNKLPSSTTQAVVGAIIGWNLFTGNQTDYSTLSIILSTWLIGPLMGIFFSALLFLFVRWLLRKLKIHLIKLDGYIRWGLIIVGAFGAYSLGANNIANVVGVFIPSAPNILVDFGLFQLNGVRMVYLLGGLSIAVGIFTYGSKVMETVGSGIMNLSPEAAIVVVLAHSLVLFIFSSSTLSTLLQYVGLPRIPLVPISSSQLVVGAIIGIGLVKGVQELRFKTIGTIVLGWLLIPVLSGALSFLALFFVQNVFNVKVANSIVTEELQQYEQLAEIGFEKAKHISMVWPFVIAVIALIFIVLIYYIILQQKYRVKAQNELFKKQNEIIENQKALTDLELKTMRLENTSLSSNLEFKRKELQNYALSIIEQQTFIAAIHDQLCEIMETTSPQDKSLKLEQLMILVKQKMNNPDRVRVFNLEAEKMHRDFLHRLSDQFPELTEHDKRLSVLLRLGFSTKEIAPLLNISPKSVEIMRYRLRKKMDINQGENLIQFISNL